MNKAIKLISIFCLFLLLATSCEKEPILEVSQSSLDFTEKGGTQSITFSTNKDWTASVSGGENWCTVSPANGNAKLRSINIIVTTNTTYEERKAVIGIIIDGVSKEVIINQKAKPTIIISKNEFTVTDKDYTLEIPIETNVNFECIPSVNWIKIVDSKGLNTVNIKLSISANIKNEERIGKVVFKNNTDSITEVIIHQSKSEYYNLSIDGTANCYIAPMNGKYMFLATVKGNNSQLSLINPYKAVFLWETRNSTENLLTNSIVKNIKYDSSTGYISFETFDYSGNAVIAIQNSSNEILWSWHIWVTNYDPENGNNLYVKSNKVLMDRNLGALSSTGIGAWGLLYQWGRKDPFSGGAQRSWWGKNATTFPQNAINAVIISDKTGTVEYSIKNPSSFLKMEGNYVGDWIFNGSMNTLWNKSKTIYDPCPRGWRVPDGGKTGVWQGFPDGYGGNKYDWSRSGMTFGIEYCVPPAWYPSIAIRPNYLGGADFSETGWYWACNSYNYGVSHIFCFGEGDYVSPYTGTSRLMGLAVRCQRDN